MHLNIEELITDLFRCPINPLSTVFVPLVWWRVLQGAFANVYRMAVAVPLFRPFLFGMVLLADRESEKHIFLGFASPFTPIRSYPVVWDGARNLQNLTIAEHGIIAAASYDMRDSVPLTKEFSNLIEQAAPPNKPQDDLVEQIQNAIEHMCERTENILELSKIELGVKPKQEIVDLTHLAWKIADEFQPRAQAKQQLLALEKIASDARIEGDTWQLSQALRNLVGNAIEYTPHGGTITLSLQNESNTVNIKIRDTGYGIPPADLPVIFDRVRNSGHGQIRYNRLGLATVKAIVEQHFGQISVESAIGEGCCFSISLPRSSADSTK